MSTKIRYISIKGRPQMQIITDTPLLKIRLYNCWKNKIKRISDCVIQVPVSIGFEFLQENKEFFGSYLDAKVADNSISKYYGFKDLYSNCHRFSTELTEKFVQKFAECGDTMIRFEINTTNESTNALGMKMPEFEHRLYENSMYESDVGDFTQQELDAFVNALGDECGIVQDIKNKFISQNMDKIDVEMVELEIIRFENKVNDIIKTYANEINDFKSTLPTREFDCGFSILKTSNENLKSKYKILKDCGIRGQDDVRIDFPDNYQCCSQSDKILDFIKEKTNDELIHSLYVKTILD